MSAQGSAVEKPLSAAVDFLLEASNAIDDRARERDHADGERSMARTVAMFNAWRGDEAPSALTELEGWILMVMLKLSRARGGRYCRDDYIDATGYMSLAGEAAERDAALAKLLPY